MAPVTPANCHDKRVEFNDISTVIDKPKKASDGTSARTPAVVLRGMPGRPTTKNLFLRCSKTFLSLQKR